MIFYWLGMRGDLLSRRWSGHGFHTLAALVVIALIPIGVALFHGIDRSFITTSDGDIVYIYEALRRNAGQPQLYHLHTGYTLFMLLSPWLKLMAWLGVTPISSLHQLPPLTSPEFQDVYAALVTTGRLFAAVLSAMLALLFTLCVQLLTRHRAMALAAGLVFASSRELGVQALHIFTELPSMLGLMAALTCLAAASAGGRRMWVFLFVAGFTTTLGLMSKMQGVFAALALPVLVLPLARPRLARPQPDPALSTAMSMLALALILVGGHMVVTSVLDWNGNGLAQIGVVALIVACIWVYGHLSETPPLHRVFAMLSIGAGIATALQTHLLHHNLVVASELCNFFDNLFMSASLHQNDAGLVTTMAKGLGGSLWHRLLAPLPLSQPLDLLNPLAILLLTVLGWQRRWRDFSLVLLFAGLAVGMEGVFRLYQLHPKTAIYVDVWLIIAVAIGLAALWPEISIRLKYLTASAMVGLLCLQIVVLTSPVMVWRQPVKNACVQAEGYMSDIKDGFVRYCAEGASKP